MLADGRRRAWLTLALALAAVGAAPRPAAAQGDGAALGEYLRVVDGILALEVALGRTTGADADARLDAAARGFLSRGAPAAELAAMRSQLQVAAGGFFNELDYDVARATSFPGPLPVEVSRALARRLLDTARSKLDQALVRGDDPLPILAQASKVLARVRGFADLPRELDRFADAAERAERIAASMPPPPPAGGAMGSGMPGPGAMLPRPGAPVPGPMVATGGPGMAGPPAGQGAPGGPGGPGMTAGPGGPGMTAGPGGPGMTAGPGGPGMTGGPGMPTGQGPAGTPPTGSTIPRAVPPPGSATGPASPPPPVFGPGPARAAGPAPRPAPAPDPGGPPAAPSDPMLAILGIGTMEAEARLEGFGWIDVVGRSFPPAADGGPDTEIVLKLAAPGMTLDWIEVRSAPDPTEAIWNTRGGDGALPLGIVHRSRLLNDAAGGVSGLQIEDFVVFSLYVQDDGLLERLEQPGTITITYRGGDVATIPIEPLW